MTKRIRTIIGTSILILLFNVTGSEAGAKVYIRIAPPRARVVKIIRPARPFRNAVWVVAHYQYKKGHYIWVRGHWVKHRRGYVYVQPGWKNDRHGYYYAPGCWVKR